MKKITIVLLCLILIKNNISAQESQYLHRVDTSKAAWFKEAKFGVFVHLGLYSVLAGTYNGITMPYKSKDLLEGNSWYAEWIYQKLKVPKTVYNSLKKDFTLTDFNADDWIRQIRDAGAKYFVITAKHHDGFALWNSKVSSYNITQTPSGKKDILGELVTACKKYGLKYGFYYSHWMDWEDPNGGVPNDKKQPTNSEFEKYWQNKCLPQVTELIKQYNPDILWFDTWESNNAKILINDQRRDELISLIRKLSDKCLINGRISYLSPGKNIDIVEMGDNEYPKEKIDEPWQTSATMQKSWGYHSQDYNWKPADLMLRYLVNNVCKGGNYLLNFGPKADGSIPVPALERFKEMGAWTMANKEAIYDVEPCGLTMQDNVVISQNSKNGKLIYYIYILDPGLDGNVVLNIPSETISSITQLDTEMPFKFSSNSTSGTSITVAKNPKYDCSIKVLKVVLK